MTEAKLRLLRKKLRESRFRLVTQDRDFAGILTDMIYVAVKDIGKMSTNGFCIYFNAAWLEKLDDYSLDYALSHQLSHIENGHIDRKRIFKGDRFHYACNVIVNARLARRGYVEDKLPGIGELNRRTLFPKVSGLEITPEEAFRNCPMDPMSLSPAQRNRIMFDSDEYWDRQDDRGECGTIVLSPSDKDPFDLEPEERMLGEMEFRMKGHGHMYMPPQNLELITKPVDDLEDFTTEYAESRPDSLRNAVQELRGLKALDEREHGKDALVERVLREIKTIPKDWRSILNHFIFVETRDFDFVPPDKRFQDDLFLPDYCEDLTQKLNVLFMVDISASLTDEDVSMAMYELRSAMDQFGGLLEGTIGFFDSQVRCAFPITTVKAMMEQVPKQGGGTDMQCVFTYVQEELSENLPSEIVIMTDGRCDFPGVSESLGIPVLWLLTNNSVNIPWGKATYFEKRRH